MIYQPYIKGLLFATVMLLPAIGQAQMHRVITKINDDHYDSSHLTNYRTIDSTVYMYDAQTNRGSNYNNDTINCDRADRYVNEHWNQRYQITDRVLNTYDQNNKITSTTVQYLDANNWVTKEADTFYYNGNLLARTQHYQEDIQQGVRSYGIEVEYRYFYDSADRIVSIQLRYPQGVQMATLKKYDHEYYSNGLLIKTTERYLDGGVWKDRVITSYSYTINNKVSMKNVQEYIPQSNTYVYEQYYYYYDAQDRLVLDSNGTNFWNQQVDPVVNTYTYNSAGLLDRHRISTPNDTIKISEYRYKYTPFGYVSEAELFTSKDTVLRDTLYGYRTRYFYEAYWPVGVNEVVTNSADITLYPNPASGELNIAWHDAAAGKLQVRIVDVRGQVQAQWSEEVNGDYKKTISTGKLPVGQYYLQLQSGNRMYTKIFMVMH